MSKMQKLKKKILDMYEKGANQKQISETLNISTIYIYKLTTKQERNYARNLYETTVLGKFSTD